MPAALGGLLSVVWNTGDVINPATVTIQDLSLSLAFIAFLLGYAFDPVLEWLEGKIRETFLKLNGETKEVKVK
jgi:predicted PurR-regulated permease PerM